jgi:hypothetical protein
MPTTTSYGPNSGGVTYTVTVENDAATLFTDQDTLTVTTGSGTLHTVTDLTDSEIDTTSGTPEVLNIGSVIFGILGNSTAVVVPGAVATVNVLSLLSGTSIYVGGTAIINTSLSALSGMTVYVDGGATSLGAGVSAIGNSTINLDNGGTFTAAGGLATLLNGTTINFGSGGGTLIANGEGALIDLSNTTINGFTAGVDKIEFQGLADTVTQYTISAPTGTNGTQTITLFSGSTEIGTANVNGANLPSGPVAAGHSGPLTVSENGANIIIDPLPSVLCFLGGTMIATPHGEAAVETLKAGDLILTADGRTVPVRWIGINTVATRFADTQRNMPIRITAGALGENLPRRDLLVSPDHALFIEGVLVQASALINDVTIHRETRMPEIFRYYHIETAAHDLILAEGAAAETFVDNVSRMAFDNWQEFMELCDNEPPTGEMAYPRAKSQRQLPAMLRSHLAAMATQLQSRTAA